MRFRLHLIALPALTLAAACGGGGDSTSPSSNPSTPTTPTTPTTPSAPATPILTNQVTVSDNQFDPGSIQVTPGTTVTWTWGSGATTHNVTFGDGANSGDKSGTGASFSRTFATAGTFTYVCTLHGGMNGSVLVK